MRKLAVAVTVLSSVALTTHGSGLALTYHSSASFRPLSPADPQSIYQNGNYAWNQSTTTAASVIANLGSLLYEGNGITASVYGYSQRRDER
jgi:hypothetical protein